MKTTSKSKKRVKTKQHTTYTAEHREKARKYYLIGLNLHEISKLLDGVPIRTLEKWQLKEKWTLLKQAENIKIQAKRLHDSGKTYKEIGEILRISYVTVWRYIKQADKIES